jgi:hypothetical protein
MMRMVGAIKTSAPRRRSIAPNSSRRRSEVIATTQPTRGSLSDPASGASREPGVSDSVVALSMRRTISGPDYSDVADRLRRGKTVRFRR